MLFSQAKQQDKDGICTGIKEVGPSSLPRNLFFLLFNKGKTNTLSTELEKQFFKAGIYIHFLNTAPFGSEYKGKAERVSKARLLACRHFSLI